MEDLADPADSVAAVLPAALGGCRLLWAAEAAALLVEDSERGHRADTPVGRKKECSAAKDLRDPSLTRKELLSIFFVSLPPFSLRSSRIHAFIHSINQSVSQSVN